MANLNLFDSILLIPIRETFLRYESKTGRYSLIFVDVENNRYILENTWSMDGEKMQLKKLIEG